MTVFAVRCSACGAPAPVAIRVSGGALPVGVRLGVACCHREIAWPGDGPEVLAAPLRRAPASEHGG